MFKLLISLIIVMISQISYADLITKTTLPGQVQKISFEKPKNFLPVKVICGKDQLLFFEKNDHYHFFFAASYFSKPGIKILCKAQDLKNKNELLLAQFTVKEGKFDEEILHVNQKTVVISKSNLKKIAIEREALNKIYASAEKTQLFNHQFIRPLTSFITSNYGSRRLFNDQKKTQHLGTDFRAPIGEKIIASNTGKVVLASELFFTGFTVILDHGLGIFSVYAHLSELLVKKGQIVESGDILGKSGNTGRVSGPHLHWGVKMNNQWVDGISMIEATAE